MRLTRTQGVLLAVAAVTVAGCGGSDSGGSAEPAPAGGTYVLAIGDDPGNLDPSMTVLTVTRAVSRLAYDSLINYDADGNVVSQLATEWETTPTSATFTLDPEATCSDGSPFTPTDAADNITYIADPENRSELLGTYVDPGTTATADDEAGTVTVEAPARDAFLLNKLANVFMVCRAGLDDHDRLADRTIGTGPWVLEEAVADDHYTYSRRDDYTWGPDGQTLEGAGVPDEVDVQVIGNQTTTANLLLSGEVNQAAVIGSDSARLRDAELESYESATPGGETWFNQAAGRPTEDPLVREALTTGTDIEAVREVAVAEGGGASTGLVTVDPKPCDTDTVSGNLPEYDVERANQLLDEAGWVAGDDGVRTQDGQPLELTFLYEASAGASVTAAAELLAEQWGELGVDTQLQGVSSTQLEELVFGTGAWDAGWLSVTTNLPSPLVPFLSGAVPPDGINFAHIDNPVYNRTSEQAAQSVGEEACALWAEGEEALFTQLDVVPMFDLYVSTFFSNAEATITTDELWGSSLRLTEG